MGWAKKSRLASANYRPRGGITPPADAAESAARLGAHRQGREQNKITRSEGTPQKFTSFKAKPHWEIGEALGIIDFERGVKISGTRFHFLVGAGARLERALIAWMLDVQTQEQGYLEVAPPLMVNTAAGRNRASAEVCGHGVSRLSGGFLVDPNRRASADQYVPREILEAEKLPIYLTAYTPCFRREKMSAGRDVRGIKRGHQFDKVEMVKVVHP